MVSLDSAKAHKLATQQARFLKRCGAARQEDAFCGHWPDVPVKDVMLPGKEQITKVRYFVQYQTGEVQEISLGLDYQNFLSRQM